MISFSGIDGSGKTTFVNKTHDYLCANGIKVLKLKFYEILLFYNIGKLLNRISKKTKNSFDLRLSLPGSKLNKKFTFLRILLFKLDIFLFKLRYSFLKSKEILLICDRYFYDIIIHFRYLNIINDRQYKALLQIIPLPELVIILHIDSKIAMKRERGHEFFNYYDEKNKLYNKLSKAINIDYIDTSGDLNKTWNYIKNFIDNAVRLKYD